MIKRRLHYVVIVVSAMVTLTSLFLMMVIGLWQPSGVEFVYVQRWALALLLAGGLIFFAAGLFLKCKNCGARLLKIGAGTSGAVSWNNLFVCLIKNNTFNCHMCGEEDYSFLKNSPSKVGWAKRSLPTRNTKRQLSTPAVVRSGAPAAPRRTRNLSCELSVQWRGSLAAS